MTCARADGVTACDDGSLVLITEPEEGERFVYEFELSEEGYQVASCARPRELLRSQLTPAVILLDAGRNLLVAAARVRETKSFFPKVPLVTHTASESLASRPLRSLGDVFLLKNGDLAAVKRAIRSLLPSPVAADAQGSPKLSALSSDREAPALGLVGALS